MLYVQMVINIQKPSKRSIQERNEAKEVWQILTRDPDNRRLGQGIFMEYSF